MAYLVTDYNKVCSFRFLQHVKLHETNLETAEHSLDELKDFKAWFDFLTLNTNVSESFNFCKLFCVFLF